MSSEYEIVRNETSQFFSLHEPKILSKKKSDPFLVRYMHEISSRTVVLSKSVYTYMCNIQVLELYTCELLRHTHFDIE